MKSDEIKFLKACQAQCPQEVGRKLPRDIYNELGMNWKRACAILAKWSRKGWYDCGTSVDGGWMTEKGMAVPVPEGE